MIKKNWKIARKMSTLVKPLMAYMIIAIIMGIAGFLCSTFIPVFGGLSLVHLLGYETLFSVKTMIIMMIVLAVLRGILRYAEQASNHYIAFRLLALIREHLFRALRRLCPAKLEGKERGNLISLLTSDVELLEVFYAHTISPVAIATGMSIIMSIWIGRYHVLLGVLALISYIILGIGLPMITTRQGGNLARQFRDASGALGNHVLDSLYGLEESIQFGIGQLRLDEMKEKSEALARLEKKMKENTGRNTAIMNTLVLALSLIFFLCASGLCLQGNVEFNGAVVSFIAFVSSFGPVLALANLGSTLQPTFASAERVFEILEEEPVVEEVEGGKKPEFEGAACEHVTFSYGEQEDSVDILKDVTMEFKKNRIIGIVGKSGSGKSTLLKLLMRFWDTTSGTVSLSNEPIEKWDTSWLRTQEGYMTQETYLFQDTIENNIRIANWGATKEEIEEACKKASIHDFIIGLPNGYDTKIGEITDSLSGGERQRIGLARAFLHHAPFLLLDEPTSNLDSLNEAVILKSLKEQSQEKTILLVSHRESTIRIVDEAYYMAEGRKS